MANINDFKLLNLKCLKYFKLLENEIGRDLAISKEKQKERLGFYLLMLESICDIKDINNIINIITDQDFNDIVFGVKEEDFGIDAVHIDEDDNSINLFNFKFREKFNEASSQGINETFLSLKFINSIVTSDVRALKGKLKIITQAIIDKLTGNDIWKFRLYVISNDSKGLDTNRPEFSQLEELYSLEIVPFDLDRISSLMSIRPESVNAVLHLPQESVLPFDESSLSSSKSFIIKITASDLIRITCNSSKHRDDYKMEDFKDLFSVDMDYNLLFDNVR